MSPEPTSSPGLNIGDILFVLSRHKWKIILATVVSLAAAAVYLTRAPVLYESEAKIMIRYVLDRSAIDQLENTNSGTVRKGDNPVLKTQIEILNSWDLADRVAEEVGAQKLAPDAPEASAKSVATGVVKSGVTATAAKDTNVIRVAFRHADPAMAKEVLEVVLNQYFARHLEIYRSANSIDFVRERVERSGTALKAADDNLLQLKKEAGILSLPEATASLNLEIGNARASLASAETDLVSQRARVEELQKLLAGRSGKVLPDEEKRETIPMPAAPTPEIVARYNSTLSMLAQLRATAAARLNQFTPGSPMMKATESQIQKLEREQRQMEEEYPGLLTTGRPAEAGSPVGVNLVEEMAKVTSLEAKVKKLRENLNELEKKADELRSRAPTIAQAERVRAVEEENFKYMGASLAKVQTDEALDPSRIPNITSIQSPGPPFRDVALRNKIAAGIAASGPGLSLAGVLLFGLVLNRSVRRVPELTNLLGLSPMLAIPWTGGSRRLLGNGKAGAKEAAAGVAPWEPRHFIRSYAAVISDRLAVAFRAGKVTHKPKLIGVTAFSKGAGVSTVAAGLAAVLSETEEGKVLLVSMPSGRNLNGSHPFMDGKPSMSLANAIQAGENGEVAPEKLCLAKVEPAVAGVPSFGLNRLAGMLPDLKASRFDYVIFDMPPLEEAGSTAAMSGMLDKVLVIVEAEKTTKEQVKDGYKELVECGADVALVMNKVKN